MSDPTMFYGGNRIYDEEPYGEYINYEIDSKLYQETKNKIKNYHIIFNDRLYSPNGKPIGLFIDWNYVNFLKTKTPLWVVRREYPRGEDGQHPGKKAHAVMADLIYYELENVL